MTLFWLRPTWTALKVWISPEPLDSDSGTLPVTAQLAVVKPGPDTIEKIKRGLLAGHESVNPEAYKLMETDRNGTGGTRPNGKLTIE